MRKLAATCAVLILAGCETVTPYIGDRNHKTVEVTWVRVSPVMIGEVCADLTGLVVGPTERAPHGCATFGTDSNFKPFCKIYAAQPASDFSIEVLGHEMLHCFIGNFHQ